jgi:KAP family P-loop domain
MSEIFESAAEVKASRRPAPPQSSAVSPASRPPSAEALAAIVDDEGTDTPLTIAISARWGAGKTSLANLVIARLRELRSTQRKPQHVICWFDAWMHEDAPHLGAALAADVARAVNRNRRPWRRAAQPLPATMLSPYQRWWRRIALAVAALAVVWTPAAWEAGREFYGSLVSGREHDLAAQLGSAGSIALLVFGVFAAWSWLLAVAGKAARFVDAPRSEAALGSMQEVRDQLGGLIAQATRRKRRLVIFVDNLERCEPVHALDACRVVSQLLGHRDVVTFLLADMSIVARAAPGGSLYLQKLIQLEFALPPADANGLARMLKRVAEPEEPADGWVSRARERILDAVQRWWRIAVAVVVSLLLAGVEAIVFFVTPGFARGKPIPLAIGAVIAPVFAFGPGQVTSARRRSLIRRIDAALREELADSDLTMDELVSRLESLGHTELVRQRAQRYFTDEEALLQQAESALLDYLLVPRSVKRALNHLRVLLVVADGRHLLGPGHELERGHLWKWVVLGERWPEVAQTLMAEPDKVKVLEERNGADELDKALTGTELETSQREGLYEFLQTSPKLGGVVDRLIRFQPAPGAARDGAAAAS